MSAVVVVEARTPRSKVHQSLAVALAVVVAGAVIWFLLDRTHSPASVARITVVNPSPIHVDVAVSSGAGAATLDLGPIEAGSTRTVRSVLDQGPRWFVIVTSPAGPLIEVPVSRANLAAAGWTVRLPSTLGERERALENPEAAP